MVRLKRKGSRYSAPSVLFGGLRRRNLHHGTSSEQLIEVDVLLAATIVAAISATYVTFGGQTSVMTDLLQGLMPW